jgi:DNA-binding winged helix-turn-helix (wHTH) protein/predicted ATPase
VHPTGPDDAPAVRIEAENEWAWCGARRLPLTPRSFAVLRYLVENRGRLVKKEELLTAIWRDTIVSDSALASCIRDLRKALGDLSNAPRYIQTVHRRGFRFIGSAAAHATATVAATRGAAPAVVGRGAELAILHARLGKTLSGQRQFVFVTGEPGIGKTALVETFLAEVAEANAARVGCGQCVEQYGAGEAYLPILEALGRLGRGAGGEQLVQILKQHAPTWLQQLPGLLHDRDVEAVQRRAHDATRGRMLRELAEALDAVTEEAPLVLLLEDLHWSDSATIDLLSMLARRREPSRLLVIATYRPADLAASHPLIWVKQELHSHGHCDEVALALLSTPAIRQYLDRRFPGHALPAELAVALHRSTEGNPLFLVNTIDDLIAQGVLGERDGRWRLSGAASELPSRTPQTLCQLVDKQIERLTADERAVMTTASVAGVEFSAALIAPAGMDARHGEALCEALARRGQLLRKVGIAEWPDGTVAGRYAFIHALYQHVFYARLSAGERVALHLQTGERLERVHGERAGEIAGELAMHFEQGREFDRAARHRRQAAENALRQHAYREAAEHATRALESLRLLPDTPERARRELGLHVTLGAALTAIQGYGAPDVGRTYERAWELCSLVGENPELLPVLRGLGRFYVIRGDFKTAREVGNHLFSVAEARRDTVLLVMAHNALGVASLYAGEFEVALHHLEQGLEVFDSDRQRVARSPAFRLVPADVTCAINAAWALWMLGYPDRAAARAQQAIALARSIEHPFSVSYTCHLAAALHHWRREYHLVQALEDEALAHDDEHGFGLLLTVGMVQRSWLLAECGQREQGLARMLDGLARYREIGAVAMVPAYLGLVAEIRQKLGRPAEALSALNEALVVAQQSGEHYWQAELYRLSGVAALHAEEGLGRDATRVAESHFRRAIDIARRQRARWLELRATICLSRLWAERGKRGPARALLAEVYGWFTEGFDVTDLREAKSLLAELETVRTR